MNIKYCAGIYKCLLVGPATLDDLQRSTRLEREYISDMLHDMVELGTVEISGDYRITDRDMENVWAAT
jgi:DNA-binding IclR family transcriptional regulator